MRAHTITTTERVEAEGRRKRTIASGGILALSLALALFAATAGSASTTPTTPAPPLTLSASDSGRNDLLTRKYAFAARTSNDSTLVATGSIKRTTAQLAAGETTEMTARIKHAKRLNEKPKPGKPKIKVKLVATDEFGQTATDQIKVSVTRNGHFPKCPDPARLLCTGHL